MTAQDRYQRSGPLPREGALWCADHFRGARGFRAAAPHAGERAFPLPRARALIEAALDEAALRPRLTDLRGAWRCHLSHPDGTPVRDGVGAGKGDPQSAQVGALYEALEHHRGAALPARGEPVELLTAAQLAGTDLARDPALEPLAASGGPGAAACRRYTALDHSGRTLPVPVFLTNPAYLECPADRRHELGDVLDYAPLSRFSTNSGTAIGATRDEALVHALAEAVERDAFSLLLAGTFLLARPSPLRLVRPASLPDHLQELYLSAGWHAGGSVALIDMTSDLGVPAFCAHTSRDGRAAQGQGASLSAEHAVRRALNELIQVVAIRRGERNPPADLRAVESHPRLLEAARADFDPHLAGARPRDFLPTGAPAAPREHLQRLTATLTGYGYRPYGRVLRTEPNGVSTVSVFVPGLERFFAVTAGACVVPGPRGRALGPG
ncbi:YcaO-like family protein [Actinomadura sp. NEAU-AAG7]|uniref:YcaO-like family protein n=1 Tax=Actinomadura sp. NEAU-AAG7 TaxID=2839640 RepID=UPI001BE3D75C|nr:YcaO-like family protein [Actinomadura sp. NEAU-AAG7]MBT2208764.1 YcaO-like family protein [Actinomadura sp. NEAU-AAG7]